MFFPGSRYASLGSYAAHRLDGSTVLVTRLPKPVAGPLLGYHRRLGGKRLDHIAAHYLSDPTGFWRLCDANGAVVPDALGAAELVGVPAPGR
jgi:hypothetical protein